MSERLVIVVSYDVDEDVLPRSVTEAMEQIKARLNHPDTPHAKVANVYAAIKEDAASVLQVFGAS